MLYKGEPGILSDLFGRWPTLQTGERDCVGKLFPFLQAEEDPDQQYKEPENFLVQ